MNILNTDMKSEFKMFSEIQDRTTVKKAYYLAGADPKQYELFFEHINVSNGDVNFEDLPIGALYQFKMIGCGWMDRRKVLFVLKNDKISLPNVLIREMMAFI